MTTMNDTTVAAERLQEPSVLLKDVTNWAEYLIDAATAMEVDQRLTSAAARLWEASTSYPDAPRWSAKHRQGIRLALDALIMQPEVLPWIAREARDRLVKTEADETTPEQVAPAVHHAYDGGVSDADLDALIRILHTVDRLHQRRDEVAVADPLGLIELAVGIEVYAGDELRAIDPVVFGAALEQDREPYADGLDFIGKLLILRLLKTHPELMQLAAERAYKELQELGLKEAR